MSFINNLRKSQLTSIKFPVINRKVKLSQSYLRSINYFKRKNFYKRVQAKYKLFNKIYLFNSRHYTRNNVEGNLISISKNYSYKDLIYFIFTVGLKKNLIVYNNTVKYNKQESLKFFKFSFNELENQYGRTKYVINFNTRVRKARLYNKLFKNLLYKKHTYQVACNNINWDNTLYNKQLYVPQLYALKSFNRYGFVKHLTTEISKVNNFFSTSLYINLIYVKRLHSNWWKYKFKHRILYIYNNHKFLYTLRKKRKRRRRKYMVKKRYMRYKKLKKKVYKLVEAHMEVFKIFYPFVLLYIYNLLYNNMYITKHDTFNYTNIAHVTKYAALFNLITPYIEKFNKQSLKFFDKYYRKRLVTFRYMYILIIKLLQVYPKSLTRLRTTVKRKKYLTLLNNTLFRKQKYFLNFIHIANITNNIFINTESLPYGLLPNYKTNILTVFYSFIFASAIRLDKFNNKLIILLLVLLNLSNTNIISSISSRYNIITEKKIFAINLLIYNKKFANLKGHPRKVYKSKVRPHYIKSIDLGQKPNAMQV